MVRVTNQPLLGQMIDICGSLSPQMIVTEVVCEADSLLLETFFMGFNIPCFKAGTSCCATDMDADTDIDCAEGALFEQGWTVPGTPPALSQCGLSVPIVSQWGVVVMFFALITAGPCVAITNTARSGSSTSA